MKAQYEYATKILTERTDDMLKGEYRLSPRDLRHEIEMAYLVGKAEGAKVVREAMTKVYHNMTVISQRNGVA